MNRSNTTPALAAALIIAHQVAGKAARDALFLAHFEVTRLPMAMAGASVLAAAGGILSGRLLQRHAPVRVLPVAFGVSGLSLALTALLLPTKPAFAAVLVFLQMTVAGPLLISGFWSVLSESFDPHAAKSQFGRAGAGANAGGILGGLLACGFAMSVNVAGALLLLAVLHGSAGLLLLRLEHPTASAKPATLCVASGLRLLANLPHLRNMGYVVLAVTVSASLIDYVFKARAAVAFADTGELLRFFSAFYLSAGVLTLIIQASLTGRALDRLGLHGTTASLPAAVLAGSAGALLVPGLASATLARACESAIRSSLFRSSYELYYVPLGNTERRAAKPVIDVCVERAGDAIGALAIHGLLLLGVKTALTSMSCMAIFVAGSSLVAATRLRAGYVNALERTLLGGSISGRTRSGEGTSSLNCSLVMDAVVRELDSGADQPASALLDHVFRLLPLAQPGDAMSAACDALLTGDALRAGMAVEYLETTLPPRVWRRIEPLIERRGIIYMEVIA